MRRTTICRSSQALLTALMAAPLIVTALGAQDTTHVDTTRVDTTRVEGAQGQIPTSHVVARGETLWSIAQMYYGDPLLWPEVYRLNTAVVEDPHWIYPGEELLLAPATTLAQAPTDTATTVPQGNAADTVHADTVKAGADTIAAPVDTSLVEPPPPPAVAESYQTIFDRARPRSAEIRDILSANNNTVYHPVRRGEYYSAGWLTENQSLPWAKVLGNTAQPAIHELAEHTSAGEFEEIAIEPRRHASYHVGDSLLVARLDRDEAGWGQVVVPLGRIHDGHLALPLEPYKDPERPAHAGGAGARGAPGRFPRPAPAGRGAADLLHRQGPRRGRHSGRCLRDLPARERGSTLGVRRGPRAAADRSYARAFGLGPGHRCGEPRRGAGDAGAPRQEDAFLAARGARDRAPRR